MAASMDKVASRWFFSRATAHISRTARAASDQITRGQPVVRAAGVGRDRTQRAGRHDVRRRGGDEEALLEPAPSAFSGFSHELVLFQRSQVVVHLLPRDADPRREGGGRCRLGQLGERPLRMGSRALTAAAGSAITSTSTAASG